jgi:hypothetical protein
VFLTVPCFSCSLFVLTTDVCFFFVCLFFFSLFCLFSLYIKIKKKQQITNLILHCINRKITGPAWSDDNVGLWKIQSIIKHGT